MTDYRRHPDVPEFHEPGLLARWAMHIARHPKRVLILTIVSLLIFAGIAAPLAGEFVDSFTLPGSESQQAYDFLEESFPQRAGSSATLVFQTSDPAGITGQSTQAEIQRVLDEVAGQSEVVSIDSPFDFPAQISADSTIAYATVNYNQLSPDLPSDASDQLVETVDASSTGTLTVEAGGEVVAQTEGDFGNKAELIGLAAAAIILLVAFGSVVAMGLPIITAVLGLITGFMAIGIAANFMDIPTFVPAFASMVGIGVGIDYALFIVTRFREGLDFGLPPRAATARAMDTAGRAVLFAGVVVVISMLGLTAVGIPFVTAAGVAAALVVASAVTIAFTVLPALLVLVGTRIDRLRVPSLGREKGEPGETFGHRIARHIQEKPLFYALLSTGILVVLALPALDLDLGFPDAGANLTSFHTRRAHDLLVQGFGPGFDSPLIVTVAEDDGIEPGDLAALTDAFKGAPGVAQVNDPVVNETGDTAVITVISAAAAGDQVTKDLVSTLREETIPTTLEGSGTTAYVGGPTGGLIDFSERMIERTPYVFIVVIGLSFLLLTMVFRSPVIAAKAAIMNLLSIAAAFGVTVAIFQWGWGASLFGIQEEQQIAVFLPMFLFAILFGLSMDYEVFLLSRIREFWVHGQETSDAVASGLSVTARVITAAAAIMICVFLAFVALPDPVSKQFGIGLAAAILIDATLVRLVLVPATMELLGDWNWWFPSGLDRILPNINIEGTTVAPEREFESAPGAAD